MITIKSIKWSGGACPYQIDATTDTGEYFYLRYRGGRLRAGVAKTEKDFWTNGGEYNIVNEKIGDDLDGCIDHDTAMNISDLSTRILHVL